MVIHSLVGCNVGRRLGMSSNKKLPYGWTINEMLKWVNNGRMEKQFSLKKIYQKTFSPKKIQSDKDIKKTPKKLFSPKKNSWKKMIGHPKNVTKNPFFFFFFFSFFVTNKQHFINEMLTQQKFSPKKMFSPTKNCVHQKDLNKKNFFPKKNKKCSQK